MLVEKGYISIKINEPQLRDRNEALFILLDISDFLAGCHNLQELVSGSLDKVLKYFPFEAGRIYLMDDGGEFLNLAGFKGLDAAGLERVRMGEGFTGKAARTRSFIAQHITDLEDRQRADLLMRKGFKIIICVPLVAMRRVVGVMNLAAAEIVELDQAKIDLLISVGNLIAVAANNARLYVDLREKVKALKTQKEAIEFFAHSISHDLKSPAVGIYGLISRLVRNYQHRLDEKGRLYCHQVLKASEQIMKLVDKINAYIVAKEAELHFEFVMVGELLAMVRSDISDELEKRGIVWREPAEPHEIVADKDSLLRVFQNLLGNALKHGGETLHTILIEYEESEEYHVFKVIDDGAALSGEDSEKLFELFYRPERSRGIEGAGLGLAIVKEIVERHGGRVWVDPACSPGVAFCVSIAKSLQVGRERRIQS